MTQRNQSNAIAHGHTTPPSRGHTCRTQQRNHPDTIAKATQPTHRTRLKLRRQTNDYIQREGRPRRIRIHTPKQRRHHPTRTPQPIAKKTALGRSPHCPPLTPALSQPHCMHTTTKKKWKPTTASRISVYCVRRKGKEGRESPRREGRRRQARRRPWKMPPPPPRKKQRDKARRAVLRVGGKEGGNCWGIPGEAAGCCPLEKG